MTSLTRVQVIAALTERRAAGTPVVAGPGATSGSLWAAGHRAPAIYNMEMGYATPMAHGIALSRPDLQVVALEGEGSAIAGMPALVTIGRYQPPNLLVVLFDNGVYGTGGGGVETGTRHGTSLAAVARACGIAAGRVLELRTSPEVAPALDRVDSSHGPWVVVAEVTTSDVRSAGRSSPGISHVEAMVEARRALSAWEGDR